MVIPSMTYSEKVAVMVGSKIIDRAIEMVTRGELSRATMTWRPAHFGAVISGLLQLPHKCVGGQGFYKWGNSLCSPKPYCTKEFHLDNVQGHIHTTRRVTIPLFGTINIHGKTDIWGLCMQVHVLAETAKGPQLPPSIVLTAKYGQVHPGSSQVPICLRNLCANPIVIPAKSFLEKSMWSTRCHW